MPRVIWTDASMQWTCFHSSESSRSCDVSASTSQVCHQPICYISSINVTDYGTVSKKLSYIYHLNIFVTSESDFGVSSRCYIWSSSSDLNLSLISSCIKSLVRRLKSTTINMIKPELPEAKFHLSAHLSLYLTDCR